MRSKLFSSSFIRILVQQSEPRDTLLYFCSSTNIFIHIATEDFA